MKLLICSNVGEFAKDITLFNKKDIYHNQVSRFEDGEMVVKIDKIEELNNEDVIVIQSISNTVNDSLIELIFTLDILKNINVKTVKLLLTYAGYSRQDRIMSLNESFSFRIIARMLSQDFISKIYLIDIHAPQTTGFFDVPCFNINTQDYVCELIKTRYENPLLVSPDVGNVKTIVAISQKTDIEYSIAVKYRPRPNENKILSLVGTNVENKDCIIVDDIVDSAGTLCNVAERLAKNGANNIVAYITHAVLSQKAFDRIKNSYLTKLYISNTINTEEKIKDISNKVEVYSISDWVIKQII